MKKKIIIYITIAVMLSGCKKEEPLKEGCAKIVEIVPPNTFYFHNPKTNRKQMATMGTVELQTYHVGDVICTSTIFSF